MSNKKRVASFEGNPLWVEDGIRTRDTLNHNQVLYH